MSKTQNGEIVDVDPSVIAALSDVPVPAMPLRELPEVTPGADAVYGQNRDLVIGNFNSGSQFNTGGLMNAEDYERPQVVRPTLAGSLEDFYGTGDTIVQPDQAYFESFPLPGTQLAGTSTGQSTVPIFDIEPVVPAGDPQPIMTTEDILTLAGNIFNPQDPNINVNVTQEAGGGFTPDLSGFVTQEQFDEYVKDSGEKFTDLDALMDAPPVDTSGFLTAADVEGFITADDLPSTSGFITAEDLSNAGFLTAGDLPSTSGFITAEDIPNFTPFDPTDLQQQITALQGRPTIDTSQFLTAADLPTVDTSGFLTAADLPTYQPIDTSQFLTAADLPAAVDTSQFLTAADLPTYQPVDTSQFLTAADLPTIDTSQFLTAADLPTVQQFDPTGLQAEIDSLRAQLAALSGGGAVSPGTTQIPIFNPPINISRR